MNSQPAINSNSDTTVVQDMAWSAAQIPYHFAKRYNVLLSRMEHDRIYVLCTEMPTLELVSELRRKVGYQLKFETVEKHRFDGLLRATYDGSQSTATKIADELEDDIDLERLAHDLPDTPDLLEAADDAPIIKLVNALLTQAIREDASDIHFEIFERRSVVRFRVDGMLRDIVEPQRALHAAIVSRLKIMAELDIAEKRLPQDGRISLRIGDHPVDVRVSCLPTRHGERVVLRILDKQSAHMDITDLGMSDLMAKTFDHQIHSPHGIVLVTGPTGSGKSTTLYAGLSRLDSDKLNIMTVEDPIEYDMDGIGQMQVNAKIDLTFAHGLRSILRQDPDVVMVGEIRDYETAEIAVQASLTGHLVLATLHTNTAIGAVTRLVDMGVEPFLISSTLVGVLAQRLVRRLCEMCKAPAVLSESDSNLLGLEEGGQSVVYSPVGCEKCGFSGYRGRSGIFELVTVDSTLRSMIHDRKAEADMLATVRISTPSLQHNGFEKVREGITSLDEVIRVTRDE